MYYFPQGKVSVLVNTPNLPVSCLNLADSCHFKKSHRSMQNKHKMQILLQTFTNFKCKVNSLASAGGTGRHLLEITQYNIPPNILVSRTLSQVVVLESQGIEYFLLKV